MPKEPTTSETKTSCRVKQQKLINKHYARISKTFRVTRYEDSPYNNKGMAKKEEPPKNDLYKTEKRTSHIKGIQPH